MTPSESENGNEFVSKILNNCYPYGVSLLQQSLWLECLVCVSSYFLAQLQSRTEKTVGVGFVVTNDLVRFLLS